MQSRRLWSPRAPHLYDLEATNPCGEQWLGPYENCCLGSINLAQHLAAGGAVDWEGLEALVAAGLICFGVLGITSAQLAMHRHADVAMQRTLATQWAQQKLEQLRHALMVDVRQTPAPPGSGEDEPAPVGNTLFHRRWAIAPGSGANSALERLLNVTVTWHDRAGMQHHVQLATTVSPERPAALGGIVLERRALGFFGFASP